MAAGVFTISNEAKLKLFDGTFDLDTDTFTVALLTTAVPLTAASCPETYSAITSEVTDDDYSLVNVGLLLVTETDGVVTVAVDGDNNLWGTIEAKWAVVFRGGETDDDVLGFIDLNTDSPTATASSTLADFIIKWSPVGLFTA